MKKSTALALGLTMLGWVFETQAEVVAADMQAKVAMCAGCHGIQGYKASFPEVYRVPKLAGQQAGYLALALRAYRSGSRKHPTMRAVAQSLTDGDIERLAAYYEAQK